MNKRIVEIEAYDGSSFSLEIDGSSSKKMWREGKCWAIWCDNSFFYIHFNRNGKATHAYCPHQHDRFEMYQYGEKWGHIVNGKLIIDAEKEKPASKKEVME